jgi:Helix-turn-helix of DDE superfamily endonuclease
MSGLRYAEVSQREMKFLDMTSLTVEEFDQLVSSFEEAFQDHMKEWRLGGKPRSGRGYTTYANCPLPTPQDRLLFILVYLKTNVLQVVQGDLFGMPQNKANQWIHTLLPVLQTTLRRLGDAPAPSMEHLAQRLAESIVPPEPVGHEAASQESIPLFAMTAPSGASNVPKTRLNRKAIIAARKNPIP